MRSVVCEILSVAVTLAVPFGIVLAFPFSAFEFRAAEPVRRQVGVSFVAMTAEAERQALRAVRESWREKSGGARRLHADLLQSALSEDERRSVLSVRDRSLPPSPPMALCERTPFLPSLKAPPPRPIVPQPETDSSAFPRKELLKMN